MQSYCVVSIHSTAWAADPVSWTTAATPTWCSASQTARRSTSLSSITRTRGDGGCARLSRSCWLSMVRPSLEATDRAGHLDRVKSRRADHRRWHYRWYMSINSRALAATSTEQSDDTRTQMLDAFRRWGYLQADRKSVV